MNEKVVITKSSMDAIGDAIRDRNGLLTKYLPSEMPAVIESIPNSYTLSDEGKVVKNSALIAQTARVTAITENGTYDTTENDSVTVNVSGGGIVDSIQEIGGLNGTNFARLSIDATDRVTRGDRYFQRNTNEPIIFFPLNVGNGAYTGYACINFRPTAPSGTYSPYGNLSGSLEKTTQSGITYYLTAMAGAYPPSTDSNKLRFQIGGTEHSINIGNADVYLGDDPYFAGNSQAIALLESYIERVYQTYYAS